MKFICTRTWARNLKGDIIEGYQWRRIPKRIQLLCFEEYDENPKPKKVEKPKVVKKPEIVEKIEKKVEVKEEVKKVIPKRKSHSPLIMNPNAKKSK